MATDVKRIDSGSRLQEHGDMMLQEDAQSGAPLPAEEVHGQPD